MSQPRDGRTKEKLYSVWKAMRKRCRNVNNWDYKYYGGKGIKVCDEWHDYLKFKEYCLINNYNKNLEIDRIDSNKDYEPDNCRFITHKENSQKRSSSKITKEIADEIRIIKKKSNKTQMQIAEMFNISRGNVANILINNIWV